MYAASIWAYMLVFAFYGMEIVRMVIFLVVPSLSHGLGSASRPSCRDPASWWNAAFSQLDCSGVQALAYRVRASRH